MFLIFAGGTYVPLVLAKRVGYFTSIGTGLVLFIVGLGLMAFLIRKKIITV
jgi:fucose permease